MPSKSTTSAGYTVTVSSFLPGASTVKTRCLGEAGEQKERWGGNSGAPKHCSNPGTPLLHQGGDQGEGRPTPPPWRESKAYVRFLEGQTAKQEAHQPFSPYLGQLLLTRVTRQARKPRKAYAQEPAWPALLPWDAGSASLCFCGKWSRATPSTTNTGMPKQAEDMQGECYRSKNCCPPPFLALPGCLSTC